MPHFIVEHSENLSANHDLQALADQICAAADATGIFPRAGIRVRMHPSEVYAIADGHPDNAFVAIIVRIGSGRDLETRKRGGQAIFDVVCEFFASEIEAGFMAVSVDMEINDPEMSFKRNGIAPRLKASSSTT